MNNTLVVFGILRCKVTKVHLFHTVYVSPQRIRNLKQAAQQVDELWRMQRNKRVGIQNLYKFSSTMSAIKLRETFHKRFKHFVIITSAEQHYIFV